MYEATGIEVDRQLNTKVLERMRNYKVNTVNENEENNVETEPFYPLYLKPTPRNRRNYTTTSDVDEEETKSWHTQAEVEENLYGHRGSANEGTETQRTALESIVM